MDRVGRSGRPVWSGSVSAYTSVEIGKAIEDLLDAGYSPAEAVRAVVAAVKQSQPSRLHEKDLSGPCAVYVMVVPTSRKPFYVGISKYPWARFDQHRHDPGSAARGCLNAWLKIFPAGHIFKIYKWCRSRNEALALEHRLISTTPGLLNRDRRRYQMFDYAGAT